jgi:predicted HicB family RNase H-like nuclease
MIEYKGYSAVIDFDPELKLFTGYVIDLRDEIYFEGDSVSALQSSLRRAVDHYLEVCRSRGEEPERPFSGKLNVRLGSELHRAAALAAASEGESLNNWLVGVVKDAAANRPTRRPRRSRSPKRSRQSTKR